MEDKIRVIVKEPGEDPREIEISNTLEAMQELVDGYIEAVQIFDELAVICNEEGRLRGMQHCVRLMGHSFVGPIIFVGTKAPEFVSAPPVYVIRQLFPNLWEASND